jgi:hypothetical protein
LVRDPASGYSIHYPPNWWTGISDNTRTFYPWTQGGTIFAPYWLDLKVQLNPRLLNAESANAEMFNGTCAPVPQASGSLCRRTSYAEGDYIYDELYAFDRKHIYAFRLAVPKESELASFEDRWSEAQFIFSRMSATFALAPANSVPSNGYAPILFQNDSDIWVIGTQGEAEPVTRGYGVRAYALSPDLAQVAFLSSSDNGTPTSPARFLYVADLGAEPGSTPRLLWSGDKLEMYDLAWYGDRELVVVATGEDDALALYRVDATLDENSLQPARTLVISLDRELRGVGGLAVSPDRQLITFLAPLGEREGTSVYAVRPDGTDLTELLAYDTVQPLPLPDVLSPEHHAIKSYLWMSGRLEHDGYFYNLLFTSGDKLSRTLIRGGGLYSAPGQEQGPLLDPRSLSVEDPADIEIVHFARSPQGKVAFTGFYTLRKGHPEPESLAGLWIADIEGAHLTNLRPLPIPEAPSGIADLQWSPSGEHLIYRETIPQEESDLVSRYEKGSRFLLVKLDPRSQERVVLFDGR